MKYKLIKTYPGSLKLNTVIEIDSKQETGYYSENTQFWQPVVEKDYEILATFGNNDSLKRTILSVKRLSDSEIFTIGDNTKYGCIDKFYIKNGYLLTTTILESSGRYLEDLKKVKQKLFTTEDGVDIFKKDWVYSVTLILFNINKNMAGFNVFNNCKIFSTREKAEEYIIMNKPYLSINEITNLTETNPPDWLNKELIKLVKSKI